MAFGRPSHVILATTARIKNKTPLKVYADTGAGVHK